MPNAYKEKGDTGSLYLGRMVVTGCTFCWPNYHLPIWGCGPTKWVPTAGGRETSLMFISLLGLLDWDHLVAYIEMVGSIRLDSCSWASL